MLNLWTISGIRLFLRLAEFCIDELDLSGRERAAREGGKILEPGIVEVAVKVIVAALTAFLTAITTTSCMGFGPITL